METVYNQRSRDLTRQFALRYLENAFPTLTRLSVPNAFYRLNIYWELGTSDDRQLKTLSLFHLPEKAGTKNSP
ncbi:hypothetical protein A1355_14325 [Methylomonas koyamae]|uniref:Uncharacterized protein n=1 Tax=Methylomonas koyamae TaxID=702114 RepID=A0A177N3L2_9GAMM|nr:hypothetical protein A1355_14325 [Methylomonas koyamae]